ncbi:4Fe-4S dicluster domain-containing protein [Sulfuricystis multivorans]|uniref:4Fe-4S dicluster domain-containing protein n=1 Tax=Sulfuricystis multivorans TaxID=2211108 RepID=UPI0024E0224B|nr:4Fe-4S dicluster domain-containing protein [Sulfuricystis multivorans]
MITRREFLRGRFGASKGNSQTGSAEAGGETMLAAIGPTCIAYLQNVVCRSCGDACDAQAIRFSPRLGGAALPLVIAERCTGCGDCLPVCPAGAITLAPAKTS